MFQNYLTWPGRNVFPAPDKICLIKSFLKKRHIPQAPQGFRLFYEEKAEWNKLSEEMIMVWDVGDGCMNSWMGWDINKYWRQLANKA